MWKVKLDKGVWLADGAATTTNEAEAWLLPDMPSVQVQLKKRTVSPCRNYLHPKICFK